MEASKQGQQQNIGDPQPWYEIDIVITNLFQHFNGKEILACHLVNKTWARLLFNVNNDKIQRWKWKMLLKETWPQFNVNVNETYTGKTLRQAYELRRLLEDKILRELWTPKYADSFKFGKYSRWVVPYKDGKFILDVAYIVQILATFAPKDYLILDGADKIEYNPEHSTSSGPWPGWTLHRQTDLMKDIQENNSLKIDQDAYAAMIICQSICTHRWYRTDNVEYETIFHNQVMDIAQQWSEETKKNRLDFFAKYPLDRKKRHMNISSMVVASCGWLKDNINNSNKNRNINDAIDIVRNTKILAFLLQNRDSLNAVFWDIDSITCRGIDCLAIGRFRRWNNKAYSHQRMSPRQYPPMFNMKKLVHHIDVNFDWNDIFSMFGK